MKAGPTGNMTIADSTVLFFVLPQPTKAKHNAPLKMHDTIFLIVSISQSIVFSAPAS
jgi:hypothetical protein